MNTKLTPKQAMFVAEYLIDGNATRAAIAVGFSRVSAAVTGARLLKNSKIAALIAERQARSMARLDVTEQRVKQELAKLAFYDPADLFDDSGDLKSITQMDEITRAAIAGLDVERKVMTESKSEGEEPAVTTRVTTKVAIAKIKLADKRGALELLGKHLKMFTDLHEHKGKLTLEHLVCGDDDGEAAGGEQAA